ncbi:MAG: JAB domain-containing protein [Ginsengibacter sp.]
MEQIINPEVFNQIAEVELIYRSKVKSSERPKITQSKDAYLIFKNRWDENKIELQEQFKVMFLNRANKVLGIYEMSTGGITSTVVDIKLIFSAALKACASGLILSHNHPSNNLKPSRDDEQLTSKIKSAGTFLDIQLMDHIILGSEEGYYSFADEGLL